MVSKRFRVKLSNKKYKRLSQKKFHEVDINMFRTKAEWERYRKGMIDNYYEMYGKGKSSGRTYTMNDIIRAYGSLDAFKQKYKGRLTHNLNDTYTLKGISYTRWTEKVFNQKILPFMELEGEKNILNAVDVRTNIIDDLVFNETLNNTLTNRVMKLYDSRKLDVVLGYYMGTNDEIKTVNELSDREYNDLFVSNLLEEKTSGDVIVTEKGKKVIRECM